VKILVHGINYHPETVGIGQYTTDMCEWLSARGHQVTVVTALPYYPWWRIEPPYRGRFLVEEEIRGVRVRRTWLHVPRRVTTPGRVLHELSFTLLSGLQVMGESGFDVLVTVSPPLFLGAVSRLWAALHGRPFLFVVQDLQPDAAADLGMLGRNPLMRQALRFLFALERWIYRGAARITLLTEGMRRKVTAKGIDPERVVVAPDWVDATFLKPVDPAPFRREHGLEDHFVVLHAGNMGVKQGLETVLEAARILREEEKILFLLVGEGARKEALKRDARGRGLENVRFLPLRPREEVPAMHAAADVCLLSQRPEVSDIVMPCKVLGILACGRPLLAMANEGTEVARTLEEAQAGVRIAPGDAQALAAAILEARADPGALRRWGEAARRYAVERWDRDRVLSDFEQLLIRAAGGN
jgi:colanic acid biosynthesis glycosyl transferase WcaI